MYTERDKQNLRHRWAMLIKATIRKEQKYNISHPEPHEMLDILDEVLQFLRENEDEFKEDVKNPGGQPGNQNARKFGFAVEPPKKEATDDDDAA